MQALCDLGFAGTSIGEIARRAGVSKGVVTYHSHTKEDLLRHLVSSRHEPECRIGERKDGADAAQGALLGHIDEPVLVVRRVLEVRS